MTFFHCVTAFTSFGSIPASDSVSLWFEKLQIYAVNLICGFWSPTIFSASPFKTAGVLLIP